MYKTVDRTSHVSARATCQVPEKAEMQVRALLDLMRENGAAVQDNLVHCQNLLHQASKRFQILDLELGEEELVKFVADKMAKLTTLIAENSQRQ